MAHASAGAAMIEEANERAIQVKALLETEWKLIPREKETTGL